MPRAEGEEQMAPILDPAPEAKWEVWYRDTFDRETRPSVDVRGEGLIEGLIELWARHLFETVRPEGATGFSRFHLRWDGNSVQITGDPDGAVRLRAWVFGAQRTATHGYRAAGDAQLLDQVAGTHALLVSVGASSEPILAGAAAAQDRADLQRRLAAMRADTRADAVSAP
jgi:hypothetical protein